MPEARGSGTCLCPRAPQSCSKAHSGPVCTYPRGLWRVIPEAVCPVSSQPIQLSSNWRLGPTSEGPSEGMKWRELGAPGLLSGGSCGQGTRGCRTPATWVAAFFASGWSGGENDLTCLKEPWVVAGIWGRGGVPRARQRGAWGLRTPPPPAWLQPSLAACGLAREQGTDLLRGWHPLSSLFPATAGKVRGADVGLTSQSAPHPPGPPSGVHCCWEAGPPWGPWGEGSN